jgi:hypothetical protein
VNTKHGLALALLLACAFLSAQAGQEPVAQYRQWIEQMKGSQRGPFAEILWFCKDGSVQAPLAFACREHGGGYQHGQWNRHALALRRNGYKIANVLAGIDAVAAINQADFRDTFGQILVEKYLVGVDDGWILRRAMHYRGALQDEDERTGARALLQAMAAGTQWLQAGYLTLRTGAKILPHGGDNASIQNIRQLSASLAEQDRAFQSLRSRIHGAPDAGDAQRVRDYAAGKAPDSLRPAYQQLASEIDRVYQPAPLDRVLKERAAAYNLAPWLQQILLHAADEMARDPAALNRFQQTAALLVDLRDALPRIQAPFVRVQVLDIGLRAELEHFRAASELRPQLASMTRLEHISLLYSSAHAAYGTGLINQRLLGELDALRAQDMTAPTKLNEYLSLLATMGRVPAWAVQSLRMQFQQAMTTLAQLEPAANGFIQDQLRGSPLLFYADVLDLLMRDANRLLGVKHHVFGSEIGFGLTALNPGMARGILHADTAPGSMENFAANGIYLLPETIADLPPVAGILTAGAGNPLSHVQLLARNLGIPNVVVSSDLIAQLASHDQQAVVLAVSPGGLVELAADGSRWDPYFVSSTTAGHTIIQPDLQKLDLEEQALLPLNRLRASDSGRIIGPKAAKLGELSAHFPSAVARGIAIPFGVFYRHVLRQPYRGDPAAQTTVFDWMVDQYRLLGTLPAASEKRLALTESFRAELYDIVVTTPIDSELRQALQRALAEVFGRGETPGLFIRSDTNVEDLPGFTGAGLNLTLPNVVGFDALLHGISRVWASPFTARAFGWRQSLMTEPQHVYTSILLLESVAVEKSGVLVTQDIDSGDPTVLTVAVNEGPGGAVDGQAAESLRIPVDGSRIKVLATATAPTRRVLLPGGGVQTVPASGNDTVLQVDEISQLIDFARRLPETFPPIVNELGQAVPADVEFGFLNGELRLFQIRPFLVYPAARSSEYLRRMDAALSGHADLTVELDGVPAP